MVFELDQGLVKDKTETEMTPYNFIHRQITWAAIWI